MHQLCQSGASSNASDEFDSVVSTSGESAISALCGRRGRRRHVRRRFVERDIGEQRTRVPAAEPSQRAQVAVDLSVSGLSSERDLAEGGIARERQGFEVLRGGVHQRARDGDSRRRNGALTLTATMPPIAAPTSASTTTLLPK